MQHSKIRIINARCIYRSAEQWIVSHKLHCIKSSVIGLFLRTFISFSVGNVKKLCGASPLGLEMHAGVRIGKGLIAFVTEWNQESLAPINSCRVEYFDPNTIRIWGARDSSVDIATGYGLDNRGVRGVQSGSGAHHATWQLVCELFLRW
jgi:hypothetical protein